MVPRSVHVISEGDKLRERDGVSTLRAGEDQQVLNGAMKSYDTFPQ